MCNVEMMYCLLILYTKDVMPQQTLYGLVSIPFCTATVHFLFFENVFHTLSVLFNFVAIH